ncbi:MAG: 16S rRNA (adenine(1518)-N(6)/adenine(1519)-N(6))-dimethyltransferase RsmA [Coriobacteriales bacterium]|jgi:16S rRNA (adenine1518-N6/adenine1519-N6)-dimethyltransferase
MSFSELASPQATRAVLERFGHGPKHRLGQNFLIDDNIIGNILRLAGLDDAADPSPRCVLEIGPGIGTLSVALLKAAQVIAVERDADLVPVLAQTTQPYEPRFSLIEGDALKVTGEQVEDAAADLGCPLPAMLVSNLPYQIAATVILDWFERFDFLERMVVMVQAEVADRISAERGSKDYGAYSVKLALHARVTGRFEVSHACFLPQPRVESAVIALERERAHGSRQLIDASCQIADAAFAQRRKTIRNSMRSALPADAVDAVLEACGIEPTVRGESLGPDRYLEMGQALLDWKAAR